MYSCTGRVPADTVLSVFGKWEKPSEIAAQSATLYFRSHHDSFPLCSNQVQDLHEFGEGHTLYFFFLQSISRLFFVIFLISGIPSIFVSLNGDFYQEKGLDAATIGNIGPLRDIDVRNFTTDQNSVENEEAFVDALRGYRDEPLAELIEDGTFTRLDGLIIASMLDCLATLVFFVTVLVLARVQAFVSADVDKGTVTVADYSLRIEGLPPDATESEVKEFFSKWGKVHSLEVVKSDCELIERERVNRKLAEGVKIAMARAAKKATQRRGKMTSALPWVQVKRMQHRERKALAASNRLRQDNCPETICAFLTMERPEVRIALANAYPDSFGRRLFIRREKRFRQKYRIKALPAPEPADIIWEHQQYKYWSRVLRLGLTTVLKYLTLLIGFFIINLATSIRHNNPGVLSLDECNQQCGYFHEDGDFYLDADLKNLYKGCYRNSEVHCSELEESCYQCFCENAVIKGLDRDQGKFCKSFLADFATATASELMAVMGVVMVNIALIVLATKFSKIEKHPTRIQEEASGAKALFLFQFINTGLTTLVATTYIPRLFNLVRGTSLEEKLFVGVYVDLTPNWYREVGRSLIITVIVQCAARIARVLARWMLFKIKFWRRKRSLTQHQLNEAYMGPEFTLALRYGELLNLIFVTMFFGGGMPLLYLITAISFYLQFLIEKAELLRLSRRPPSFGPDLAKKVGRILPFAALLHCGFSAWAFSIQRTEKSSLILDSTDKWLDWIEVGIGYILDDDSKSQAKEFRERLVQITAAHHVILFFLIAFVMILKVSTSFWLRMLKKLCTFLGIIKGIGFLNEEDVELPDMSDAVSSGLLIGPTSYSLKSNPKYLDSLPSSKVSKEIKKSSSANDLLIASSICEPLPPVEKSLASV